MKRIFLTKRRIGGVLMLLGVGVAMLSGCGNGSPHEGRLPFSWMENPPRGRGDSVKMKQVLTHAANSGELSAEKVGSLRPGDVVAFHMSHREAWKSLRKGKVQKLPYDLFRYGHIALVVPGTGEKSRSGGELRLLQVAMKQAVNADAGVDYLNDKSWVVFRPPAGQIDEEKLREFTTQVRTTAGNRKTAYDYSGALGVRNAPWQPDSVEEIGDEYSCATLVVAGLHYAGFPLDAVHRKGLFDIVTPRQVVESGASQGASSTVTR